jgi:hypothetical protein
VILDEILAIERPANPRAPVVHGATIFGEMNAISVLLVFQLANPAEAKDSPIPVVAGQIVPVFEQDQHLFAAGLAVAAIDFRDDAHRKARERH